jgi:hypothetical protein
MQVMRANKLLRLDDIPYPSGRFVNLGENLRTLTRSQVEYIPPVKSGTRATTVCPIIVPTNRNIEKNRKNILRILQVASGDSSDLVVFLCSGKARKDHITKIARTVENVNWIAIEGPFLYEQKQIFETPHHFLSQSDTRDTTWKRNFGLQLARHMGWRSVFFLDDDLVTTTEHIHKALDLLEDDNVSVVGFTTRSFPDNSVAVHARRLVEGEFDCFIGTGALAVKTTTRVMAFFPHIYNEDWLFLLIHCLFAAGSVVWAGTVRHRAFNPFKDPERAGAQEIGDLLGEGLMRLAMSATPDVQQHQSLDAVTTAITQLADEHFWQHEINNRLAFLGDTQEKIQRKALSFMTKRRVLRALALAEQHLVGGPGQRGVQASELESWVQAWMRDLHRWNNEWTSASAAGNLAEMLDASGYAGKYAYDCSVNLLNRSENRREYHQSITIDRRTESYIDMADTAYRPTMSQGVDNTKVIQQYLTSQRLDLSHISKSATQLRFDRPTFSLNESKPLITIVMFVAYAESLEQVAMSVSEIINQVGTNAAVQLIMWVHSTHEHEYHELDGYRNRLVARLICDIEGTNIRLRSSVIADTNSTIDHVVTTGLRDLALAYWKSNIPADHHVAVINSRREIMRFGVLSQIMRAEHSVTHHSLARFLGQWRWSAEGADDNPITRTDDDEALNQARRRLVSTSRKLSRLLTWRDVPTTALRNHMKRAGLNWIELDKISYDVTFYSMEDERSLRTTEGLVCIAVTYVKNQPADKHLAALEVARVMSTGDKRLGLMIVIQANENVPHHDLEMYRHELMKYVAAERKDESLPLMSFVDRRGERNKARSLTVAYYTYWLYDHHRRPFVTWQAIHADPF